MSRLISLVVLVLVGGSSAAAAQGAAEPAQPSRERISVSLATNVALEGSGPWFAPGLRLGVPLTRRLSVDLESSAVFGGKLEAPYGSITSFFALNARRLREDRAPDGTARYWLFGLRYTPIKWPPEKTQPHDDLAVTFGHGWDQIFPSRWRVGGEIGLSGGNGFLLFATLVIAPPMFR
jgi:hypothetical protein